MQFPKIKNISFRTGRDQTITKTGALHAANLLILLVAPILANPQPASAGQSPSLSTTQTHGGIDLLHQYPTKLVVGDTAPERARPWEFTGADIFRLSHFRFEVLNDLRIETGTADLGKCLTGCERQIPTLPHIERFWEIFTMKGLVCNGLSRTTRSDLSRSTGGMNRKFRTKARPRSRRCVTRAG